MDLEGAGPEERPCSTKGEQPHVRTATLVILASALSASALSAQTASMPAPAAPGNPLIAEAKAAYTQIKNNLTAMAAKMPPEDYDFKPNPDIRTFGALIAHIADTQTRTCSALAGERKTGDAASKTAKADLVAALQASFNECDAAWNGATDANAFQMAGGGRMQRSRLGTLIGNTVHDNEEYGYGAVYMRLKGIVPPSTENVGGGRGMAAPGR